MVDENEVGRAGAGAGRRRALLALSVLAWVLLLVEVALVALAVVAEVVVDRWGLLWVAAVPVPTLLVALLAGVLATAPRSAAAGSTVGPGGAGAASPVSPEPTPAELERQPSWQPDQASGAVWTSASAAASGAGASSWGRPGEGDGWRVEPPAAPAPESTAGSGWEADRRQ